MRKTNCQCMEAQKIFDKSDTTEGRLTAHGSDTTGPPTARLQLSMGAPVRFEMHSGERVRRAFWGTERKRACPGVYELKGCVLKKEEEGGRRRRSRKKEETKTKPEEGGRSRKKEEEKKRGRRRKEEEEEGGRRRKKEEGGGRRRKEEEKRGRRRKK